MARPVRVEFEKAVYHVTARGNERKDIFRDVVDRERFLETLEEAVERFGLVVHAYCLMPNYYHLLLQAPRGNLSDSAGRCLSNAAVNSRVIGRAVIARRI